MKKKIVLSSLFRIFQFLPSWIFIIAQHTDQTSIYELHFA